MKEKVEIFVLKIFGKSMWKMNKFTWKVFFKILQNKI